MPARRPGVAGWLAVTPVVLWLALLVVVPTALLGVISFCQTDDDGTLLYKFTAENYRQIFDPAIWPVLRNAAFSAAGVAALALATVYGFDRRFSRVALGRGLLVGGAVYLSYRLGYLHDLTADAAAVLRPPALPDAATYLVIFWKSIELAGLTTLLCLLLAVPVAVFLGRSPQPWRNRLLLVVMIPFWTSFLVRTYAWITILNENGLLNGLLKLGNLTALIPASGGYLYTPAAVVIGLTYAYLPFMILPIFSSVEAVDPSLLEASLDLGAGPLRTVRTVLLPLCGPGIVAGVLLVFVPAVGMFAVTDLMSGNKVPMIGNEIETQFTGLGNNQPLGAAFSVILLGLFGLAVLATGLKKPSEVT